MTATARRHILPPSTTALERAIDQTAPAWDGLADALPLPRDGTPATVLPWVAAELQLSQFAPYFASTAELIEAGRQWLLVRGTAAAVLMVLGWVGFADARVDEQGAYLHLNLGRPATAAEIGLIAHVVRASVPAHVRFWRVFHGHDRRPLRLDGGQPLDKAQLDSSSGVWVSVATGEPVKASFGLVHRGGLAAAAAGQPQASATATHVGRVSRRDKPVLDSWRLDSRVKAVEFGGLGAIRSGALPAYQRIPCTGGAPGVISIGTAERHVPQIAGAAVTAHAAHELPPAMPQPKDWQGTWGAQRWRPVFIESKSTEST